MAVTIKVNIDDSEVKALLMAMQRRLSNMTPVMKIIGDIIRTSVIKNFEVEGRPPWKKSKRALIEGGQTLTDTARLRKSIVAKAYHNRAEIGTNVKYAAIHQFGGVIKAKTHKYLKFKIGDRWAQKKQVIIPARPFLMIQDEDWAEIKHALTDYLLGGR